MRRHSARYGLRPGLGIVFEDEFEGWEEPEESLSVDNLFAPLVELGGVILLEFKP